MITPLLYNFKAIPYGIFVGFTPQNAILLRVICSENFDFKFKNIITARLTLRFSLMSMGSNLIIF